MENDGRFLNRVISGGESWFYKFNLLSRRLTRKKIMKKLMLLIFFDVRDVVHLGFFLEGQTVHTEIQDIVFKSLRNCHGWILAMNIVKIQKTFLENPSYSSDLAPWDFFPSLKCMKCDEIFRASTDEESFCK